MSSPKTAPRVKPPFCPPLCSWHPVSAGSPIPDEAMYQNGNLDGDEVYIGRVYDGNCIYIGTAIPKKGICIYLNKMSEVKSSQNYEILTVDSMDPLWFLDMELDHRNILCCGIDEESDEILYAGRYVDEKYNTYYGWVNRVTRSIHIPRQTNLGPQVLDKSFAVLIHRFLDRMCTGCPMPPGYTDE